MQELFRKSHPSPNPLFARSSPRETFSNQREGQTMHYTYYRRARNYFAREYIDMINWFLWNDVCGKSAEEASAILGTPLTD
jgi:hypothetical protein